MKKNKWYIYFSCLLIAFILFVFSSVSVGAFTNDSDEMVNDDTLSIYNGDYEIDLSFFQPLVANYYYTEVQGASRNYSTNFTYGFETNSLIGINGVLSYNKYDDALFADNVLYNDIYITNNNIMGLGYTWGFGFSNPLYIDYNTLVKYSNQSISFISLSEYVSCYTNIKFSYLIKENLDSPFEIKTFIFEETLFSENDGLFSDDALSIIPLSLIDFAFEEEEPYYVNPIIRIDYIYTYFDIDSSADVSSSYDVHYLFPVMYFEDYLITRYNVSTWENYDISLGPIDFNIGESIYESVTSVLNIEILPNFSFMNLLLICISVPILIYILKLFLGG